MPAAEQGVIHIRAASPDDAAELLEIYAPYVRETAISFEYEVPALDEFRARITATLARYPYLAAERGGALLGYAYCGAFSGRAAYALSAETSIYVRRGGHGRGIGRRLYEALFAAAKAQNLRNLYADAAYPDAEDEYLTYTYIYSSTSAWATESPENSATAAANSGAGTASPVSKKSSARTSRPPRPSYRSRSSARRRCGESG